MNRAWSFWRSRLASSAAASEPGYASPDVDLDLNRDYAVDRRLLLIAALALPVGLLGTLAAWLLLTLIHLFTNLFFFQQISTIDQSPALNHLGAWVVALPVLGGLMVGLMARFGSEKIRGHGIPEAIETILFAKSRMSGKVALLKPLSSGLVIGSGGPFGAEGPIIMTGGALGSLLAQLFHLSAAERKTLLVAGATAGMTAVFGTPVAAVLLAVELLLFELRPRSLLAVSLACAVAGFARALWLDAGRLFPLHTAPAGVTALGLCIVVGVLAALLAAALSRALYAVEDLFAALPLHWMWWPALGGVAVGVGGWLQPRALGVGYDVIGDLLNHRLLLGAVLMLLAAKAVMWVIALGSGTSGGVLAPLLMIGAGLGSVLAACLPGSDAALWPLVGMAAMLSAVLGAPLTATVFAVGLTGDGDALLPLLLACAVSHGLCVLLMRRSIMTERLARRGRHVQREYGVDPLERLHVDDVMSRDVQSIPASTAPRRALDEWFGAAQRHRGFPVVEASGRCLGLLDRQLLSSAAPDTRSVGDLLRQTRPPLALPGQTCRALARRLALDGLERLPVVADLQSCRLVGIVSRSDLLKAMRLHHDEELVRERLVEWRRRAPVR